MTKRFAVLNARFHEQEAYIVAEAGVPGAITIATNMAGRGTDIKLGGNVEMRVEKELADVPEGPEREARIAAIKAEIEENRAKVLASGEPADPEAGRKKALPGGLYIIGTERHESRRIDNQLRGRSGRQGDPGRSKFYLSLQDDLMRIFGSDRMDGMLTRLGLEQGEAIIHPWINKAIEKAQQKVEARNFDMRKNVLKYDNVMNDQRKVVFEQRRDFMGQESVRETVGRDAPRRRRRPRGGAHARERLCRAVGHRGPARAGHRPCSTSTCRWRIGPRRRASPTRRCASACARPPTRPTRRASRRTRPR